MQQACICCMEQLCHSQDADVSTAEVWRQAYRNGKLGHRGIRQPPVRICGVGAVVLSRELPPHRLWQPASSIGHIEHHCGRRVVDGVGKGHGIVRWANVHRHTACKQATLQCQNLLGSRPACKQGSTAQDQTSTERASGCEHTSAHPISFKLFAPSAQLTASNAAHTTNKIFCAQKQPASQGGNRPKVHTCHEDLRQAPRGL